MFDLVDISIRTITSLLWGITRSAHLFARFVGFHTVREIIILLIPDTTIIKKIRRIKFNTHERKQKKKERQAVNIDVLLSFVHDRERKVRSEAELELSSSAIDFSLLYRFFRFLCFF